MSRKNSEFILSILPIIRAHAEGKEIESQRRLTSDKWLPAKNPSWHYEYEYRIKPEPKINVNYANVYGATCTVGRQHTELASAKAYARPEVTQRLKYTFTDGKLTNVEILSLHEQ